MPTFLKFVWIAFVQYWGVWVTGTGLVGLALWGLSFAQAVTGWKMKPRYYIILLFCVFWFLATFSAWHDADKNLTLVTRQRAQDTGDLGACRGDLKAKSALLDQSGARIAQQQGIIDNEQSTFNNQQATLNSCVVSLGKANVPPAFHLEVHEHDITSKSLPRGTKGLVLVANVNRGLPSFDGFISCNKDFTVISASLTSGSFTHDSADYHSVQHRAPLNFQIWETSEPLVVILFGKTDDQFSCPIVQK